jgi:hypothetical protein
VREAAARAQCSNNLKQLVLALHNYSDRNDALPCGTMPQPSLTPDERLSWLVALLPYLEQADLYNRFDETSGWASEHNRSASARPVKCFICPSQPMPGSSDAWPLSSYVGIAGVGADAASLPLKDARCGVFGYERRTTMKDIKDGTSCTLCILETCSDNGQWAAGGRATVRPLDPEQQPYIGENRPFGMEHRQPILGSLAFSRMPELANAAMLDGSVRILNASISAQTLEAMSTIAGNDKIGFDF